MRIDSSRLARLLVFMFMIAPSFSWGAQSPDSKNTNTLEAARERAKSYYRAIQAGNQNEALQIVAPESKDDFFHMNYTGLTDFRIADGALSDAGNAASFHVWLTQKLPSFPQLLDREIKDNWKLVDGQWYIVLPSSKEIETPFGKMKLGAQGNARAVPAPAQVIQQREADVDEDQYMIALQKAARQKKESKPEENKTPQPPPDDKAKPQM